MKTTVKVFWMGLAGAALALSLGLWILSSRLDESVLRGAILGYLVTCAATLWSHVALFKDLRNIALRVLALGLLIKLVLLVGGAVLLSFRPELGDWQAYALAFIAGYFIVCASCSVGAMGKRAHGS